MLWTVSPKERVALRQGRQCWKYFQLLSGNGGIQYQPEERNRCAVSLPDGSSPGWTGRVLTPERAPGTFACVFWGGLWDRDDARPQMC